MKPLIYTTGEPAGIGPDLAVFLANNFSPDNRASTNNTVCNFQQEVAVIADPDLLLERAEALRLPLDVKIIQASDKIPSLQKGELAVIPVKLPNKSEYGKLNPENAAYVLSLLDTAIEGCLSKDFSGMITGPVQKSVINEAGISFSGHTEYLAEKTKVEHVVMMLATESLRVALATTHLPLSEVPKAITPNSLKKTISILHSDLQKKFGIKSPRILVCGLNPHAGEGGHLGREEIDIIIPALDSLKAQHIDCIGPLPADTLFTPDKLTNADAVLAMYHDQGLPVLKYQGFGAAANITLGLPIVRTSVDHGTALDLAGTGKINPGSLYTAIHYAQQMCS